MKHFNLEIQHRSITGNSVRKIRRTGSIPAVIYSKFVKPINIQFNLNAFIKLFRQSGKTGVIDLNVENNTYPCLVHKVDVNPVTDLPRHVDFLVVDLTKTTEATVPIVFVGESSKSSGGTLIKQLNTLSVEALPEKTPHEIKVDLSVLKEIGDTLLVSDIASNNDYQIISEGDSVIAILAEEDKEVVDQPTPTAETVATAAETQTTK